ncbi:hypothetical protein ACMSIO_05575 [Pseudomonas benzopyrenica]|uniref:hypothetical protein n=1 Tax=Pseudomonas benzopyrenica TaxID=2993566 RepID=UPI0039C2F452
MHLISLRKVSKILLFGVEVTVTYGLFHYIDPFSDPSPLGYILRITFVLWVFLCIVNAFKLRSQLQHMADGKCQQAQYGAEDVSAFTDASGDQPAVNKADAINEQLTQNLSPIDRRSAARRLLEGCYGQYVDSNDVDRLDDLAAQGWRVTGTLSVNALCLTLSGKHRIFIPEKWLERLPLTPASASPTSTSSAVPPARADDPWYSPDVLKFFAARNTFTLFQRHGGIDLDWTRSERQRTHPISRDDCQAMLKSMQAWIRRKTSEAEATALGTDLEYVRHDIAHITDALAREQHRHCHSVMWEATRDDNRERDDDDRRADEYCHRLYSGPADE